MSNGADGGSNRGGALMRPSPALLSLFRGYLRWYIGRHFHALRVAHAARFPRSSATPLIVCVNHPSWWDPLVCLVLSHALLPDAEQYAPMDAAELQRYSFFRRLGLFPVEQGSARGAAQFVRSAQQVFARPGSVLWMTPQGDFADVRQPFFIKSGAAHIAEKLTRCTIAPIAIEYVFWSERLPEILINCGAPIEFTDVTAAVAKEEIVQAMSTTQQELAALSIARAADLFRTLVGGAGGVGNMYGLWQRMRGRYRREHGRVERHP